MKAAEATDWHVREISKHSVKIQSLEKRMDGVDAKLNALLLCCIGTLASALTSLAILLLGK